MHKADNLTTLNLITSWNPPGIALPNALPYGHVLGLSFTNYYIFLHFLCAEVVIWKRIKEVMSVLPFVGRFDIPDIAEWI